MSVPGRAHAELQCAWTAPDLPGYANAVWGFQYPVHKDQGHRPESTQGRQS